MVNVMKPSGFPGKVILLLCVFQMMVATWASGQVSTNVPIDALDQWFHRDSTALTRVRFQGDRFIAMGQNGELKTSPDGVTWTARSTGTTNELRGVVYGDGLFVVVGANGTVLTSTDGTNWALQPALPQDLNDVAWRGSQIPDIPGLFVATASASSFSQPNVFTSGNATNWAGVVFTNKFGWEGAYFTTAIICIDNSWFITAGGPLLGCDIWWSTGGDWLKMTNSSGMANGFSYGNDITLMIGWDALPRVSNFFGWEWLVMPIDLPGEHELDRLLVGNDITFGNGMFAVARDFRMDGLIMTTNALSWSRRSALAGGRIASIAYGKDSFVAVCSAGNIPLGIYQSADVSVPFLSLDTNAVPGSIAMRISGKIGAQYRLQTSSNFVNWIDQPSFILQSPSIKVTENVSSNPHPLFYRLVKP
jgi:hypothetical protein